MVHQKRIPEYIRRALRSAFCNYVLDHACRYRDSTFKANAEALAREDINIQSILVSVTDYTGSNDQLVRALLAFSWYRRDTMPLIAVAEHTLKVARATGNERYIAEALLCLGSSYSEIDNHIEAKHVLEECTQLLVDDPSSQQLGFECALGRAHIGSYLHSGREEIEALIDGILADTKDSDTYWPARALDALGWLYWCYEEFDQALGAFVPGADMLLLTVASTDSADRCRGNEVSIWVLNFTTLLIVPSPTHRSLPK